MTVAAALTLRPTREAEMPAAPLLVECSGEVGAKRLARVAGVYGLFVYLDERRAALEKVGWASQGPKGGSHG